MDSVFLSQIITSFLFGGCLVGILSLLAERSSRDTAGIILSLPSTMAVGLFFMGFVLGPDSLVTAAPVMPLALGGSYIFVCAYVTVASRTKHLSYAVSSFIAFCTGLAIWLLIAVPLALAEYVSLTWSLIGYAVLILVSHYLLAVRPNVHTDPVTVHFTMRQIMYRSIVAGTLISLVVIFSKVLGPTWGGIFSMFPAAMLSTAFIVHKAQGPRFLLHILRSMPLSSPAFILYMLIAVYTFPVYGIWWGTALSYIGSLVYLWVFHWAITKKN